MEKKLTTPILFLIFNRTDTTQRVFNEIRKAKPAKLFVAADGLFSIFLRVQVNFQSQI